VLLFNRGDKPATISASADELGLKGRAKVRDLWAHRDVRWSGSVKAIVEPHGVAMFTITPL